ncbi:extracellular calcium-sensing receptor-like [Pelmatolapia mariae]|uniref:extracellular calcium-sensing receptor-like n=1 Tax=Pelmatolapia mariae TaxID=158779 RepID=UPI002FE5B8B4
MCRHVHLLTKRPCLYIKCPHLQIIYSKEEDGLSRTAASMSWFSWLFIAWSRSSQSLLLVWLVGRELGIRDGLLYVQMLTCSHRGTPSSQGLFQDGDVIIGGLFPLHYKPPAIDHDFTQLPHYNPCTGLEYVPLQYIYAMVFALEEINHSTMLLPGIKLGYHIFDSCGRPPWALQSALSLVGGDSTSCNSTNPPDYSSGQSVPMIIGGDSSITSQILSTVLGPLSIPFISDLSTCPCLSDRLQYPNFFRTIPSDIYQARAVAQLVIRFNWTWVGAVVANNNYGYMAVKIFQEEIQGAGVCLAFVETLQRENIISDARRAALTIQASTARVILIFTWYTDVRELFLQLAKLNVTDRQFLASDLVQNSVTSKVANGVLGVATRSSAIPGFESYLRRLHPIHRPDDEFLREFWEVEFGCSHRTRHLHLYSSSLLSSPVSTLKSSHISNILTSNPPVMSDQKASLSHCNGTESLKKVQNLFTDASQLRVTYNVYLAVYAAAHALHSLLCPIKDSPSENNISTCSSPKQIKPTELLQHLQEVNFTTPQDETFYFQGADIPAKYDLVNWQKMPDGTLKITLIGHVDGFALHLNESAIQWITGSNRVPTSVCSEICPPGTRKVSRKGKPLCCFDCIPCAAGEISNKTGSLDCERCPLELWSNAKHTGCIPRQLDFLAFNETLGITLTTAAVTGVTVTTVVFVVFVRYHHTPVVRANNSDLSFLLLVSIKLCFLCSLVFIGRPSDWSCRFQQAAFGISFVLCVSCLKVKTIVVLAAFRSARPGAEALMKWFGPGQQRGSVFFFTCVQVIICIIWLSISPPVPKSDLDVPGLKVTLKCATASVVGFSLVLGYIGLLGCTSFLLAFLARKLPDNFNEAKLITFSMLIFCAVWVAFVPAYVSSPGKYAVAVEIFAILASSYGLLFCIFAPKCFIILLRPEKNTKKHLMGR